MRTPSERAAPTGEDPEAFARAAKAIAGGILGEPPFQNDHPWNQALHHPNPAFLRALIAHTPRPVEDRVLTALAIAVVNRGHPSATLEILGSLDTSPVAWAERVAMQSRTLIDTGRLAERKETLLWAQAAAAPMDREPGSNVLEKTVWEHLAYRDNDEGRTLLALLDDPSSLLHREAPPAQAERLKRLLFHSVQGGGHTFAALWERRHRPDLPPVDSALHSGLVPTLVVAYLSHPHPSGLSALETLVNDPVLAFNGLVALIAKYQSGYSSPHPFIVRTCPREDMCQTAVAVARLLIDRGANPDLLLQLPDVHAGWLASALVHEMPSSAPPSARHRL